jgi:flagellar FliL protein
MPTNVKAQKVAPPAKGTKVELAVVEKEGAEGAPPRKKRGKWLWIALLALLVLGGGGGGTWYYLTTLQKDGDTPAAGESTAGDATPAEAKAAEAKPGPPPKPLFVNLDPFTVNLVEENGDHYLQTAIVLQVTDEHASEAIKLYMPIIRNRYLLLLSSKRPSELMPVEGKQKLAEQLLTEARGSLPGESADKGIVNGFFASFVIQ